jgi:S-methylmethionine-dependent homocysteine/selenocysteine methylase
LPAQSVGYVKSPYYGAKRGEHWHTIDHDTYYPERYTSFTREWLDLGAQNVGGCATGPEHIAAVAPVVKERRG